MTTRVRGFWRGLALRRADHESASEGAGVLTVQRVYQPSSGDSGLHFLVERLWPRGVRKEALPLDGWLKDVAPSDALRRWFGHDPAKWAEFRRRYFAELDGKPASWRPIMEAAAEGSVTLLYSARDTQHNSAVALRAYLEQRLADSAGEGRGPRPPSRE